MLEGDISDARLKEEVEVRRVQFENHTIVLGLGYHKVLSYDFFCFINLGLFVSIHRSELTTICKPRLFLCQQAFDAMAITTSFVGRCFP